MTSAAYDRWLELNVASMFRFFTYLPEWTENGTLIERDGLIAAVSPDTPYGSIFNSVIYNDPAAVAACLDELADAYADAGVKAWTVWVSDSDNATAALLEAAGHQIDTSPRIMGRELNELEPHTMDGIEWTAEAAAEDIGALNDAAYAIPPGTFYAGCGGMAGDDVRLYEARLDGESAACLSTLDLSGDLGIYTVATAPEAQGKGLATALMRQALSDGRERGLETTSLQASAAGRPVYARLGYEDVGSFDMWERRVPKPGE